MKTAIFQGALLAVVGISLLSERVDAQIHSPQNPSPRNSSRVGSRDSAPTPPEQLDRKAVDRLLRQARAEMEQGQIDKAELILRRIESAKVSHGFQFNLLADTPKKLRRDLEKVRAKSISSAGAARDPFLRRPASQDQLAGRGSEQTRTGQPTELEARATSLSGDGPIGDFGASSQATASRRRDLLQPVEPPDLVPPSAYASSRGDNLQRVSSAGVTASSGSGLSLQQPTNVRWPSAAASGTPGMGQFGEVAMRQLGETAMRDSGQMDPLTSFPKSAGSVPVNGNLGAANGARQASDRALISARLAVAVGDLRRARRQLEVARGYGIQYGYQGDSPAKVEAAIRQMESIAQERKNTPQWQRLYATALTEQAEALLAWRKYDEAERLAGDAIRLGVEFAPFENDPRKLLQRIVTARRDGNVAERRDLVAGNPAPGAVTASGLQQPTTAMTNFNRSAAGQAMSGAMGARSGENEKQTVLTLLAQARGALERGDLNTAHQLTDRATRLNVPDSRFTAGEDRPWLVALEIQKQQMRREGVVQASGATAAGFAPGDIQPGLARSRANFQTAHNAPSGPRMRLTQNLLPESEEVPKPIASADDNDPMWFFEQGEESLRRKDTAAALNYFQQAALSKSQLDAATQRKLEDHLQLLSAAPDQATVPPRPLGVAAVEDQELLARQLTAEVARAQSESRKLRVSEPRKAMELLESTQQTVSQSGLDAAARAQLLRRLELSIGDLDKYIEDHRAEIELDEQNSSVLADIERRRKHKIEVQNEIARLVNQFNTLLDEQRQAEALTVANRLRKLAPNEPVTVQILRTAQMARRQQFNEQLVENKEQSFLDQMDAVELSSASPLGDRDYVFGADWATYSKKRLDRKRERQSRLSATELKIKQSLRQPVKVEFENTPLSEVMDRLSKMTGVPIYLDRLGLSQEGVLSDTPVTIRFDQEIQLKSALNMILDQFHLTYVIKDEVLKITSEELRDGETYQVIYFVADLVIPIPNFVPGNHMGLQGAINDAHAAAYASQGIFGPLAGGPVVGAQGSVVNLARQKSGAASTPAEVLANVPAGIGGMGAGGGVGAPAAQSNAPFGGPGGLGGGVQADFDPLIDLIVSTVEPTTWDDVGGPGSIRPFENNLTLVISQTEAVHEQIADLLEQLRSLQALQVTIEVRFITLNDRFFERIGIDFDFNIEDGDFRTAADLSTTDRVSPSTTVGFDGASGMFTADLDIPFTQDSFMTAVPAFGGFDAASAAGFGFAILSDIEAFFLIQAAQGDQRTNVLEAPKVTLFNGQTASVSDVTQRPFVISVIPVVGDFAAAQQPVIAVLSEGTFMTIQAVVSEDQRYVRLTVVPFFSQIGDVDEFTFDGSSSSSTSSSGTDDDSDGNDEDSSESTTQTRAGTTVQLPNFSFVNVTTTVSVPDGGTVLLGGIKRLSEGRAESGVPMLSKIPYVNRLFRNVGIGRETQSLMMMVTPRIIIQEEEEDRISGGNAGP